MRLMSVRRRVSPTGRIMKRILLVCAALAAALGADASLARKPTKPAAESAGPVEIDDVRMGETLSAVCLPSPATCETYDGRDNLLVAEATDGSHAFLQLSGDCRFNALMFAQSISPKTPNGCVKVGDVLVVADSFGGSSECRIARINRWKPEATYLEDYDQGNNP